MSRNQVLEEIPFFPLFINLQGRKIVIAGAGKVAERRIRILYEFGANVSVIAPAISATLKELAGAVPCQGCGSIELWERRFEKGDLADAFLVIAATDDHQLNAQIGRWCKEQSIQVNVASDKALSDFYFPGIVRKGNTVIGVTESGADHKRARELKEKIYEEVHYHWD